MEIYSFENPASLESSCWEKKVPLGCFEMEKVYSFFFFTDSRSNWPDFLKLGMKTPCLEMEVAFRRFLARGSGGLRFLHVSLQLSLSWDRSGRAEEFLRGSKWVPLLLGLLSTTGQGNLLQSCCACYWQLKLLVSSCYWGWLLFPKPEDIVWGWGWGAQRGHERREEGGWEQAELIHVCSGLAGKHNEVKRLLGWCAFLHFPLPGLKWEGGMGKKERKRWRIGKAWAEAVRHPQNWGGKSDLLILEPSRGTHLLVSPFLPQETATQGNAASRTFWMMEN